MILATADCRDGYDIVAAQVVLACVPISTARFGNGRGDVMTLESLLPARA